jgi:hypothetical protein
MELRFHWSMTQLDDGSIGAGKSLPKKSGVPGRKVRTPPLPLPTLPPLPPIPPPRSHLPPPTLPLPTPLPLPRRSRAARLGKNRLSYKVPRVWGSIGIFLEHLAHSSIKAMRCSSAGAAPDIAIRGRQQKLFRTYGELKIAKVRCRMALSSRGTSPLCLCIRPSPAPRRARDRRLRRSCRRTSRERSRASGS